MFRSINAGNKGSWVDLGALAQFSDSQSAWAAWGHKLGFANWMGPVIDPFNSNNAFYGTGGGIWGHRNGWRAARGSA